MSTDIISSIDDTLAGYEGAVIAAGGDMMRWSPQRVICDSGKPLAVERKPVALIKSISVTVDTGQFDAAIRAMARAFAEFSASIRKSAPAITRLAHLIATADDRKHRARCRTCNPHGNPEPLAIDGREYNRRRKARQRRKR